MATVQEAPSPSSSDGLPSSPLPFAFAPVGLLRTPAFGIPVATWIELLRFTAHRLEAQADFWQRLCRCSDLSDAVRQQSIFIDAAVSDYASETAAIAAKAQEGLTAAAA